MSNYVTAAAEKRQQIRNQYWPDEKAWTGENENGWFRAPRTLPLILTLLRFKALSGRVDPTPVYLELLARHRDNGVVEMSHELEHAYAAGYTGKRALRSWQERMILLEKLGFIRCKGFGNHRYKYVLVVHPVFAVERLRQKGLVEHSWYDAYTARQIETTEESYASREKRNKNVVPIGNAPKKKTRVV